MIKEIDHSVAYMVAQNDGYCPCATEHTEETKCPCKAFRDTSEGVCECGRYEKVKA